MIWNSDILNYLKHMEKRIMATVQEVQDVVDKVSADFDVYKANVDGMVTAAVSVAVDAVKADYEAQLDVLKQSVVAIDTKITG